MSGVFEFYQCPKSLPAYSTSHKVFNKIPNCVIRHRTFDYIIIMTNTHTASNDEVEPLFRHGLKYFRLTTVVSCKFINADHMTSTFCQCPFLCLPLQVRTIETIPEVFLIPPDSYVWMLYNDITAMIYELPHRIDLLLYCHYFANLHKIPGITSCFLQNVHYCAEFVRENIRNIWQYPWIGVTLHKS